MHKDTIEGKEARQKLAAGISRVARIVGATYGPGGRNVVLETEFVAPKSIRDGVTIANSLTAFACPYETLGARLLKEAASKTNDLAGDGTTTSTILANSLVERGIKKIDSGLNPVEVKKGIDKAVDIVVNYFKNNSKGVSEPSDIEKIATISAANDSEIGKLISNAFEVVGHEGVVTLEESATAETTLEAVNGMKVDRGFLSPYFVNETSKMEAILENPYVLIVDNNLSLSGDLVPILKQVAANKGSLLVVANKVEGEALAAVVVNHIKKFVPAVAIHSPSFGEKRQELLNDIAILTGGTVVSEAIDTPITALTLDKLGRAKKVIVNKESAVIVANPETQAAIDKRIEEINAGYESCKSIYQREFLAERKAKLGGGIATIRVGAPTEPELKDKKLRIEDAINATKAAIAEGIQPGGGSSQAKAAHYLGLKAAALNDVEKECAEVVADALSSLAMKIALNAGYEPVDIAMKLVECQDSHGFNALTGEWGNMYDLGVVDPVKVSRSALQNAASVAGQVLLTEALVIAVGSKSINDETPI